MDVTSVKYIFHKRWRGGIVTKLRALYWVVLRRWETEICLHCGRPVRQVWWCREPGWWEGVSGREDGGGVMCVRCFDEEYVNQTGQPLQWEPRLLK